MHQRFNRRFRLHCRHGLLVDYMSDEWLDMLGVCIDELKARGMEAWLYDEDDWLINTFFRAV